MIYLFYNEFLYSTEPEVNSPLDLLSSPSKHVNNELTFMTQI